MFAFNTFKVKSDNLGCPDLCDQYPSYSDHKRAQETADAELAENNGVVTHPAQGDHGLSQQQHETPSG